MAIAEGAHFRGSVDMQRKGTPGQPKAEVKPAAQPGGQQQQAQTPAGTPAGQRVGA